MSNEIKDSKKIENESAVLEDYEVEVAEKRGFFAGIIDKIKGKNSTKLLTSGNKDNFQKTNRSISSMWAVGSIRRGLMQGLENLNRTLFGQAEKVDQSNITTEVVGKTPQNREDLSQNAEKTDSFEPVIPISKSAQLRSERIIPQPVKTGIINNAKSAKDVQEEVVENHGLKAEEVTVSEEYVEEFEEKDNIINELTAGDIINSNITKNIQNKQPVISVEEIKVGQAPTKDKQIETEDGPEL